MRCAVYARRRGGGDNDDMRCGGGGLKPPTHRAISENDQPGFINRNPQNTTTPTRHVAQVTSNILVTVSKQQEYVGGRWRAMDDCMISNTESNRREIFLCSFCKNALFVEVYLVIFA